MIVFICKGVEEFTTSSTEKERSYTECLYDSIYKCTYYNLKCKQTRVFLAYE